jgi:glutamate decarboxylase
MPTFTLNFSRPGSQVAAQYYNFIRLGFDGYRAVQQHCRDVAVQLAGAVDELEQLRCLTDGSELPAFAFALADGVDGYSVYDVSARLREGGWIVPAYQFPKDREDLHVLRIVVRNGFTRELADHLLDDLGRALDRCERDGGAGGADRTAFHH